MNIKNRSYYFYNDLINIKDFNGKYYPQIFLDECLYEV